MARKAVIDNTNAVVNVIEADDSFSLEGYTLKDAPQGCGPGDVYDPDTESFFTPRPPLKQRKSGMRASVEAEFQRQLATGFTDSNGIYWAATPDAVQKTMMLSLRIAKGKGLPNGKSTVTLYDASNQPHSVDEAGVDSLAEKGSDFRDSAEDRLAQLYGQINSATTHDELDAIDPKSGWPE